MYKKYRRLNKIRETLWDLYEKVGVSKQGNNMQPLLTEGNYSKLKNKFSKNKEVYSDIKYLLGELGVSISEAMHNKECLERENRDLGHRNQALERRVEFLNKGKNN